MIVSHDLKLILIRIPCAGYGDIAVAVSKLPGTEIITHPVFGDHLKLSDVNTELPDYRKVAFFRNPVNWVTESWFYCTKARTTWPIWGTKECNLRDFVENCFMQMDWVDSSVDVYPIEDRERVCTGWKIGVPSKWQDTRQWDHPIEDKIVDLINERLAS